MIESGTLLRDISVAGDRYYSRQKTGKISMSWLFPSSCLAICSIPASPVVQIQSVTVWYEFYF